jgi:hypothetical protein
VPTYDGGVEDQPASSRTGERPAADVTEMAAASAKVAAIVEAAERAAVQVIDDAEEQARRHLEEAQAGAGRLAAERLRALADELDPLPASRREPHLKPVEAEPGPPAQEPVPDAPGRGTAAGARLLATQMAVSGNSRAEIEARLRNGFEIEDAASILDAILGPED